MNILDKIKKDNIGFRKTKSIVKATLTTTLLGEIQAESKRVENKEVDLDELTLSVIKRFKKNMTPSESSEEELSLLESYLPPQMSLEEVKAYIKDNFNLEDYPIKQRLTGEVLKKLGNSTNGKVVSEALKSL